MGYIDLRLGMAPRYRHSQSSLADNQVTQNGLTGSIMTFYEITDGDLSYTTGRSSLVGNAMIEAKGSGD